MESIPYHIIVDKKITGNLITLPKSLYRNDDLLSFITFGVRTSECKVTFSTSSSNQILISPSLWEHLSIPYEGYIHTILNNETLHLGPLVGIFTAGFTGSNLRPIGDRSFLFAKMASHEKQLGTFTFVFGAHHINWEKGTINGYFYHKNGWIQKEVPFPHVVYDRLPNRKTENYKPLQSIKKRLQSDYLIPWFNSGFFNKWEIHKILNKDTRIKPFLPTTIKDPSVKEIKELLYKYRHIFLKPANGSLGLGIHQIIYSAADQSYYCRFNNNGENFLRKYSTLDKLLKYQLGDKSLETYIAQQGIDLLRIDHKPIDFRVHTNKNNKGTWEITAIAAKIAGTGSPTTHLKNGGKIKTLDELNVDQIKKIELVNQLTDLTLLTSQVLEEQLEGLLGEIGFDIGVDKDGNVWLFEANSKPGRSIFNHPKLKQDDLRTRRMPFTYALYLTEKTVKTPGELFL